MCNTALKTLWDRYLVTFHGHERQSERQSERQRLHVFIFSEHELHNARQRGLTFCRVVDAPSNKRYTPMCWMWEQLAVHAHHHFQPAAFVLLGDDTQITPHSGYSYTKLYRQSRPAGKAAWQLGDRAQCQPQGAVTD